MRRTGQPDFTPNLDRVALDPRLACHDGVANLTRKTAAHAHLANSGDRPEPIIRRRAV